MAEENGVNLDESYDCSNVADADTYETIPEGDYHVECIEQQWGLSKNDNTKLEFKLKVLTGEHAGFELVDTLTFTPDGMKRVKFVLGRFGDADMSRGFKLREVNLVGKQAIAHIVLEPNEYNGKTYDKNKVHFTGYSRPEGFGYLGQPAAQPTAPPSPMQQQHAQQPPTATPASSIPPPPPSSSAAPPPPPPVVQPMPLSPDGQFAWNGVQWIPAHTVVAPPTAPPVSAPGQKDRLPF